MATPHSSSSFLRGFAVFPSSVFALLTQFLPLPDKLLQLTHVSHAFPALTPPSFASDTIGWTPWLVAHLSASPPPPLLSLLSHIPKALLVDRNANSFRALCALLFSRPSGSPPFPGLRAVSIAPTLSSVDGLRAQLLTCLAGLRLCPNLTALDLNLCRSFDTAIAGPSLFRPLTLLSSLTTLRISNRPGPTSDDFLLILSLPLTTLDLCTHVKLTGSPPSRFPPLPHLRILLLPLFEEEPLTAPRLRTEWEAALLSSLTDSSAGGLERLLIPGEFASRNLHYLLLLRRLHTLQLRVHLMSAKEDVLGFYAALISSPLPLRHLRLQQDVWISTRSDSPFQWYRVLHVVLPAFLSTYAGQLLSLDFSFNYCDDDRDERQQPPRPPGRTAEAMTAALFSCHSLRRAQLYDWCLSAPPSAPAPAFPHLESLELVMVWGSVNEVALITLLDSCPHLQELILRAPWLPHHVLPIVAMRCHELRTLVIMTQEGKVEMPTRSSFRLSVDRASSGGSRCLPQRCLTCTLWSSRPPRTFPRSMACAVCSSGCSPTMYYSPLPLSATCASPSHWLAWPSIDSRCSCWEDCRSCGICASLWTTRGSSGRC